ncbi:LLM class F420-dependent oxidoreductase [Gordonia sp. PKS22-38]|uniref:LLM class F420-dependent oxidoreductase n=1 Tax=Gordonia prachuapensis TaxID=3115651 RepID=A0ABU7MV24_9ACTN|nr:LLM class F420-dependent oxidoreductase [Gordonia sp. PKS22-38]
MEFGIVQFTSDRGLKPHVLAPLIEEAGFASYFVPEHGHIPTRRDAAHPQTGDSSLPDDRYMRTLDPWTSLAAAAAVTERIRLATAVALPVQSDPITLAKTLATLDHISDGRLTLGVGFGWNLDELADHKVPPKRRRTMLREYLESMRALWTDEEAEYHGEFVDFGPSWAWPKPAEHIPTLVGAAGNEKNFKWITRSADGWITTPGEDDIEGSVALLKQIWSDAGRAGDPQIVVLDFKPVAEKLDKWREIGVTQVLYGLPDDSVERATAYLAKLAGKLDLAPVAAG